MQLNDAQAGATVISAVDEANTSRLDTLLNDAQFGAPVISAIDMVIFPAGTDTLFFNRTWLRESRAERSGH